MKLPLAGVAFLLACVTASPARAVDQTVPGAANALAVQVADRSPLVRQSLQYLRDQAQTIRDAALRRETLDATTNDDTCVRHRAALSPAAKQAILDRLLAEGLYAAADAAAFPGGAMAGVFPPVLEDGARCPRLPQPFRSAPGSSFRGHHSMPGGLPIHEAFNEKSDVSLAEGYARNYRVPGLPASGGEDDDHTHVAAFPGLNEDVILAAPIWHDWAKSIVFQWNADGSEFREFNFGGNGQTDAFGAAGDSRTGGHHIMSVAESMARRLAPDLVITQASAHSTPTNGNEYRNVALSQLSAERIAFVYQRGGLAAVQAELDVLHARGVL